MGWLRASEVFGVLQTAFRRRVKNKNKNKQTKTNKQKQTNKNTVASEEAGRVDATFENPRM
jgi:hypothetical protein